MAVVTPTGAPRRADAATPTTGNDSLSRLRAARGGPLGRGPATPRPRLAGGTATTPRRGRRGLVTLEWLLIIGGVGMFAALSVLVVERTLEDEVDVPEDDAARLVRADIDAAFVAAAAVQYAIRGAQTPDTDDDYDPESHIDFAKRCQGVVATYPDVLQPVANPLPDDADGSTRLPADHPWDWDWDWDAAVSNPLENSPEGPAKCVLTPREKR